jgi:hypothetical protein
VRRTTLAAAALVPAFALALTACGSKSPSTASAGASSTIAQQNNAHLTQAQLVARLKTDLASVTALHMKGSQSADGAAITMDMQINKSGTAQGTVGASGLVMPLITIGSVAYIQITPSYANLIKSALGTSGDSGQLSSVVSQLIVGKWIKTTTDSSLTSGMGGLTDFSEMIKQLGDSTTDTFSYLGTGTVDGQQVAQYKDVSPGNPTATMSIPLTGSALPIQEGGGSAGMMTFTWNTPTTVTAPPAAQVVTIPDSLLSGSATGSPSTAASS